MVSDVAMPGIPGNELCELMRTDERLAKIPVILLTVKFLNSSMADCYQEPPVHTILTKPLSSGALENAVAECFSDRVGIE